MFRKRILFLVSVYLSSTASQNCKEYSETCEDDKDCCGGCCLKGICRDMYEDCRLLDNDPCLEVYCSANEECYTFQPMDCGGCGPSAECRTLHSTEEITPKY